MSHAEWKATAHDIGAKLAEVAITGRRPVTDREAEVILERAGTRLCTAMLRHGVPVREIEAILDALAEAFDARLKALEQGMVQPGGRA